MQTGLDRERADKYLKFGYGGLVGFEPKGGEKAPLGFIDRLKLFYHLANIGDARSLAIHPSSMTHGQLNPEQQAAAGISPAFVRVSIGIEDPNDIIADIAHALDGVWTQGVKSTGWPHPAQTSASAVRVRSRASVSPSAWTG